MAASREQNVTSDGCSLQQANLLAQHELNVEIFDAFADTLCWLHRHHALDTLAEDTRPLVDDLSGLFHAAPPATSLYELSSIAQAEQRAMLAFYGNCTFNTQPDYVRSAQPTVSFVRRLAQIFRRRLFPTTEMRLFILIDEYEALLEVQQV